MYKLLLHRIWICLITISPCVLGGITLGFSSIALPEMNLSLDAASWFGCLIAAVAPFGSLISGYVIDKFGRKPSLVLSVIPDLIGWLLIATYRHTALWQLFLGRFCTGLSSGACFFAGQSYLAEIIDLDPTFMAYRSSFTNAIPASTVFGYFLVIIFGTFFSYRTVAWIAFIFSMCIVITILIYIPESPTWLYEKGRYGDAEWSQKRLKLSFSFENFLSGSTDKTDKSPRKILEKLKRRDVYIPVFITSVCLSMINLGGTAILSVYLVNLIDPEGQYSLQDSYNLSAISATVALISSISLLFFIPHIGIRKLIIGATIGMMISMLTYGIADYFTTSVYADLAHGVSIVAIWLAQFCNGFGFGAIPRAIVGEIFPPDAKGFAAISTLFMYAAAAIVLKFHPILAVSLKGSIFIVYALINLLQAIFLFKFLPETVGRTIVEINNGFFEK